MHPPAPSPIPQPARARRPPAAGPALTVIDGGRQAAPQTPPAVPRQRVAEPDWHIPDPTGPMWSQLAEARARLDESALAVAESTLVAAYRPLAHFWARRHGGGPTRRRAAEAALRKAVHGWPQPTQPWGFEEYTRGAIEAELRRDPVAAEPELSPSTATAADQPRP